MSILVTWKSDRYEIDMIQEFGPDWINIKLNDLIQYISLKTQLPVDGIKLLSSGGTKWEGSFGYLDLLLIISVNEGPRSIVIIL